MEDRKLTWRHDWAWLIAYAVILIGFMAWSILWRHQLDFYEVCGVTLGVIALNIIRGIYITRSKWTRTDKP